MLTQRYAVRKVKEREKEREQQSETEDRKNDRQVDGYGWERKSTREKKIEKGIENIKREVIRENERAREKLTGNRSITYRPQGMTCGINRGAPERENSLCRRRTRLSSSSNFSPRDRRGRRCRPVVHGLTVLSRKK